MTEQVDILLATYQGASYVQEQIHSILNQTYPFIHIWIRDDGSSDQTRLIIQELASTYSQKISVISSTQNLGIKGNFSELLKQTKANYIMFSDQDDFWLPNKVELSLQLMNETEKKQRLQQPILVHTDLKVVQSNLVEISNSFWQYTGLNPRAISLNRLLAQNIVTGCTMMMNRPLVDLAQPIPDETVMHDWWIALVAAAFGTIDHLNEPTLLYRQHGLNDIGAKKHSLLRFLKSGSHTRQKHQMCLNQTYEQAQAFLKRYHLLLNERQKQILQAYTSLKELSYFAQKKQIIKFQFFKHGFLRNIKTLFSRC
jgi:glycosyltransferase involved in cell wall biosynthesis